MFMWYNRKENDWGKEKRISWFIQTYVVMVLRGDAQVLAFLITSFKL